MVQQKQEIFKTERKTIDGHAVESTALPGLNAVRLKAKLAKKVFPAVGKFFSGIKMKTGAKGVKAAISDLDLSGIGGAFESIAAEMEPDELEALILEILSQSRVDGKDVSDTDVFNVVFSRNMLFMYKVVLFSLEVNFGDFLSILRTGMKKVQTMISQVAETPKSTQQSSEKPVE
jgi:hypothetical protein